MKQPRPARSAITLMAVLAAGCDLSQGAAELPPPDAPLTSSVTASLFSDGCPSYGCGSNGPFLGISAIFHELDVNGAPNNANVVFLDFRDNAGPLTLNVNGDRLQGIRGNNVLEGPALINSILRLRVDPPPATSISSFASVPSSVTYEVTIRDVGYTGFWTGKPATVPVYKFEYKREGHPNDNPVSLCEANPTDEASQSFIGKALVFRGDRYDVAHKTLWETGAGDTWFNIGCAGTFVAKMHQLRHTFAGASVSGTVPTVPQRQAMLKMLTADYCGTGRPFTEQGVPLLYAFDQQQWARVQPVPFEPWPAWPSWPPPWPPQWVPPPYLDPSPSGPSTGPATPFTDTPLDAVWNQDGAVCLNTARLEHLDTAHPERLHPDIRVDIDFECERSRHMVLKPCPASVQYGSGWSWTPLGYAISASWQPPPPP